MRRKSSVILSVLVMVFLLVGVLITWMGVPLLAESKFGPAAPALTRTQVWGYSLRLLLSANNLITPASDQTAEQAFSILSGESIVSICSRLQEDGLIPDAEAFRNYLIYKGLDSRIKAGEHQISPNLPPIDLAERIQSIYTDTVPFFIYPGWRAEEIAASLTTSGIEVSSQDFLDVVQQPADYGLPAMVSDCGSAEGFLYPGEYVVARKISAEELVRQFVEMFEQKVPVDVLNGFESRGLTVCEGVTLASIIQKETFRDEERALIASVFYNRMAIGMKLETDPTVQYALGYSDKWGGWWKTPLRTNDLKVESPFNTYLVSGLPPAPIANPDLPSLKAVAFPESSEYYYFRAKCDQSGFHDFSITFEEHNSKACQ